MPTRNVADELAAHNLRPPNLEALRANERSYTALLMQPSGPAYADEQRIGPLDIGEAGAKSLSFMRLAVDRGAHLAVAPEYFIPWVALEEAIDSGLVPPRDALWVLGCEGLTEPAIQRFIDAVQDRCLVIHEPWTELARDREVLDAVALMFQASTAAGDPRLVVIVQFKTQPSRDETFFEERILRRGSLVYKFLGEANLSLAAVICSDAFALEEPWLSDFQNLATLVHIQLNPDPRNVRYRQYRTATFEKDPRATSCHIICLNWARNVELHMPGGQVERWGNIAGSIFYCPETECSASDVHVRPNHDIGIYYAHLKERRHALVLHYYEAVYERSVPKLISTAPAVQVNRNGPSATARYEWDGTIARWNRAVGSPNAGLDEFLSTRPAVRGAIASLNRDPLSLERALALTAGAIERVHNWQALPNIDSFQMESTEVVRRVSIAQDPAADEFRHQRLSVAAQVRAELEAEANWPPQVSGINRGATLQWQPESPAFNVLSADGSPSLVVYLGENPLQDRVERKVELYFELLRQQGGRYEHRLCLFYRQIGGAVVYPRIPGLTRFDDALGDSTDVTSAEPMAGESL